MVRFVVMGCCAMLLCLQAGGSAWAFADDAASNAATPQAITIEEDPADLPPITVTGERPRALVRREMYEVESQAYRLFNELNTEDDYDMVCRKERRAGSQFTSDVCKARFHREAESQAAGEFLDFLDSGLSAYHVDRAELDREYLHQRELMIELANANPKFRELLEKRYALRQEFEAKGGKVRYGISSDP